MTDGVGVGARSGVERGVGREYGLGLGPRPDHTARIDIMHTGTPKSLVGCVAADAGSPKARRRRRAVDLTPSTSIAAGPTRAGEADRAATPENARLAACAAEEISPRSGDGWGRGSSSSASRRDLSGCAGEATAAATLSRFVPGWCARMACAWDQAGQAESLAAEVAGRRLVAGNRLCAVSPPRLVQLQACII